jgi:hypothetical protein
MTMRPIVCLALLLVLCSCAQKYGPAPAPPSHPVLKGTPTTGGPVALNYESVKLEKKEGVYHLVVVLKNDRTVNTDTLTLKGATVDGVQSEGVILSGGDPARPLAIPFELAAGFLTPEETDTVRFVMPKDFKPAAEPNAKVDFTYTSQGVDVGYEGVAQLEH